MKIKSKLAFMGLLLMSAFGIAQTQISGIVTADDGSPIPGVNVIVQGTDNGTTTDFDGNFTISASSGEVLSISYVGFATQNITLTDQTTLEVMLQPGSDELDEVIIIGYGSQRKSDVTGAVASVKSEDLNAFPLLSATQALQGRAAGVAVQSNNGGEPGAPISIRVRGSSSIGASSNPLIVVDGFVGAAMPQPTDIQSLEVLKDASATAIYGSRGSGGVILVTTKKGKAGSINVEVNSNYSSQNVANTLDLLNADQFASYQQSFNSGYTQGSANTDWQDLIYQNGNTQTHQFAVSGGTEKLNVYTSANYFSQDGIIENSDFEKLTFLSNIDAQVNDKLKVGMSLFGSRSTQNGVLTQSTGRTASGGGDDVVSLAIRFAPDEGIYDGDNFSQNRVGDGVENPYAVVNELKNETKRDDFRANFYGDYQIVDGLSFKSTFGYSSRNETEGFFKPQTFVLSTGTASLASLKRTDILNENYLTYIREFGKSNLTLLAGYSYQKRTNEEFAASTKELLSDDFLWYNLAAGHVETRRVNSYFSESEIISQFGRVNFDFDDKYLLTATVRRDGASNFAANEKYAIFPSAALGWKISNEEFLADNPTISNLKLRASYGVTGNQAISPYQSLAELNVNPATAVGTDPAISVSQENNPDLKWESSYQTNIGVDLGLMNNKISLSLDYYNIDTKDLLMEASTTPLYSGATDLQVFQNIGEINNSGFELSINTVNITNENFTWTSNFNLSTNTNKVVKLVNGADIISSAAPGYFAGKDTYILREGEAIGLFWGHEFQGVYDGGSLPAGTALKGSFTEAGDPLFTDINGDGEINTNDLKIIGDPNADFNFGFTNNFTYGDFDMNIFFQGSQGGEILNLTAVQLFNGDSNTITDALNAWSPTNTNSNIPSNKVRDRGITSQFVEDGSYIRLKNIAVGYNFPNESIAPLGIDQLRLSISAQNLFTITDYSGLDPEVAYFGSGGVNTQKSNVVQGHDFGNYPTLKSVNVGLNLKF